MRTPTQTLYDPRKLSVTHTHIHSVCVRVSVCHREFTYMCICVYTRIQHNNMRATRVSLTCLHDIKMSGQGQRSPSTYCFQSAMPRLPVPRLSDTIRGYLESVEPVLSKDEYECARLDALAFQKSASAARCQAMLVLKSWVAGNYVSDWWEKVVYLRSRAPLLINSNYYGLGWAYHPPTSNQVPRAFIPHTSYWR